MSSYLLWCSPYCPVRQHCGVVGPVRIPIVSTAVCHEEEQLMWQIYWVSGACSLLTCLSTTCSTHNSHTPDSHTSEGLFSSIASCFWLLWTLNSSCLLFPYAGKALGDGWSICLWSRRSTSNVCSTLDISVGSYHDINAMLKYKSYLFWHTHMYVRSVYGCSIQSSLISIKLQLDINSAATSSLYLVMWWLRMWQASTCMSL